MRLRIFNEPRQGARYSDISALARLGQDLGFADAIYLQVLDLADHDHVRLIASEVAPHL